MANDRKARQPIQLLSRRNMRFPLLVFISNAFVNSVIWRQLFFALLYEPSEGKGGLLVGEDGGSEG
jgi:hypothetical protein